MLTLLRTSKGLCCQGLQPHLFGVLWFHKPRTPISYWGVFSKQPSPRLLFLWAGHRSEKTQSRASHLRHLSPLSTTCRPIKRPLCKGSSAPAWHLPHQKNPKDRHHCPQLLTCSSWAVVGAPTRSIFYKIYYRVSHCLYLGIQKPQNQIPQSHCW